MTANHDDHELQERIRRATDHFTFERPIPNALSVPRSGQAWRIGSLVAAAAFGAAVTLLALAIIRPQGPSVGSQSPMPNPSPTAPTSTPGLESPTPDGTEVPLGAAQRICLATPGSIPGGWLGPGETADEIATRFASLPLASEEQRPHAGLFVFADERFLVLCEIDRRTDGQDSFTIARALREGSTDPIGYSGGTSTPASVDALGHVRVADLVMYGPAATDVARVDVLLEDGSSIEAHLFHGLWLGWWNRSISAVGVRATLDDGSTFLLPAVMKADANPPDHTGAPASPEATTGG